MDVMDIVGQLFGVEHNQIDAVKEFFDFSKNKTQYVTQFSLMKKQLREIMRLVITDFMELPQEFKQLFEDGFDFALWRTTDEAVKPIIQVFRKMTVILETLPAIHDNPHMFNSNLPLFKKVKDIDYGVFTGEDFSEVEFARIVQRGDRTELQHEELMIRTSRRIATEKLVWVEKH